MLYSAAQLEIINRDIEWSSQVLKELIQAMEAGVILSIAEEEFVGSHLQVCRGIDDNKLLSLHEYPAFQNFLFNRNYLIYNKNLNGALPADTPLGPIHPLEVVKDIALLDRFNQGWLLTIKNERHSDRLLQYVGKESRNQLKNFNKFAAKLNYGSNLRSATEKSIVLHSKYFFYKVKKYFQELGTEQLVLDYCGYKIVIDGYAHFHILFRHYAKDTKPYQTDASYHADQDIDPNILPTEIGIIIDDYFESMSCSKFDASRIYFKIRGVLYAIWFRPMPQYKIENKVESVLRVQTFYPVVAQNELDFMSSLNEIASPSGTLFFV